MKIVINRCFGGFCVSRAVFEKLGMEWDGYGYICNQELGIESDNYYEYRTDTRLIAAIEDVGAKAASGDSAQLKIVEIPDNVEWEIDEYDGIETVREVSRSWG